MLLSVRSIPMSVVFFFIRLASLVAAFASWTPFKDVACRVEAIDGDMPRREMSRVVVGRAAVLLSAFAGRGWLKRRISSLPVSRHVAYVLKYSGCRRSFLVSSPGGHAHPPPRGIRLPDVVSARVGQLDVSAHMREIGASFEGAPPSCKAIDTYLRHRAGVGITAAPLVLVDGSLRALSFSLVP